MARGSHVCSGLFYLLTLLQIILAAVIVVLVATKLDDVRWEDGPVVTDAACTLGTSWTTASLCVYSYVVAGVSMAVSLGLAILMCVSCNMCGIGKLLSLFIAVLGTAWWAIAGALVQKNLNHASTTAQVVSGLVWAEAGLYALLAASSTFWVCGCCKGREYESMA